jgi:hypothetical protein
MEEELKKKIDESWKEAADKEKKNVDSDIPKEEVPPANFSSFITSLSIQALMFLGEIANPMTNKKEKDLTQARFIIDILDILKEKTKGNLNADEQSLTDTIIYELKMKFASLA